MTWHSWPAGSSHSIECLSYMGSIFDGPIIPRYSTNDAVIVLGWSLEGNTMLVTSSSFPRSASSPYLGQKRGRQQVWRWPSPEACLWTRRLAWFTLRSRWQGFEAWQVSQMGRRQYDRGLYRFRKARRSGGDDSRGIPTRVDGQLGS
jgi:hypothetical protein